MSGSTASACLILTGLSPHNLTFAAHSSVCPRCFTSADGTCASDILPTEQKYFGAALNLRQQFDAVSALAAQNIVPSNTDGFSLSQLKSALTSAYGSGIDVTVSCDSKGYIQELTSCFDLNLEPIACPSYADGGCTASTLYLPSSMA